MHLLAGDVVVPEYRLPQAAGWAQSAMGRALRGWKKKWRNCGASLPT